MAGKILIIDDDTDVILFLKTILADHGYDAMEARNGAEGWDMIHSERPDLILLDLMMPQRSGISLLSELKRDNDLKGIPVIMVTGVAGETGIDLEAFLKRSLGKSSGDESIRPDGYLEKPVEPDRLIDLIREFID
jgi:CheY-like chemotaxis protein